MLFNSFAFAMFLPVVFIIYWVLPKKFQWIVILISSYYFYMSWNVKYVFLILLTTMVSYVTAVLLEKEESSRLRKLYLAAAFFVCLSVLFFFKYFNFVSESIAAVVQQFSVSYSPFMINVLLPVGISFYTFQTLAYVVDVYRGGVKAEHHLGKYAAFISFFPQLVAGPIERTENLLPQIKRENIFDYGQASYGLKLMAWGFFKKIVVADTLAVYVDTVYNNLQNYKGMVLAIATVFFTIQIYCDFSGYSDMAVGIARLFGVCSMENFKSPYLSANIKEFWERWHRSLSGWLRDYVYIPLGGSRKGKLRTYFNLMITFLISGIWHGANLTFLVWGALHGIYQVVYRFYKKHCKWEMPKIIGVALTFAFVSLAWIFFRADSVYDAFYMIRYMGYNLSPLLAYHKMGMVRQDFYLIIGSVSFLFLVDFLSLRMDVIKAVDRLKAPVRWAGYLLLAALILAFHLHNGTSQQFIYFQF